MEPTDRSSTTYTPAAPPAQLFGALPGLNWLVIGLAIGLAGYGSQGLVDHFGIGSRPGALAAASAIFVGGIVAAVGGVAIGVRIALLGLREGAPRV